MLYPLFLSIEKQIERMLMGLIDNNFPLLYYDQSYLKAQQHQGLHCYEDQHFFFPLSIDQAIANSIPKSPFGSVYLKDTCNIDEFLTFFDSVQKELKERGVAELIVNHPSEIYEGFVAKDWLITAGLEKTCCSPKRRF
jgi:hypothetical protein